jgi:hypothetical protein
VDDAQDRSPVETLCDVFVYAPLGLALEAPKLLPELAAKGRNQVAAARTVGRFVVSQAAGGLAPLAGSVLGGVLRGLSGSRRSTGPTPVADEPTPPAPAMAIDAPIDPDDVVVVPDVEEISLDPEAVAEAAGGLEPGEGSRDGQLDAGHKPGTGRRADVVGEVEDDGGPTPAEGTGEPGDGLAGAPLSDDDVPEPDLEATPSDAATEADAAVADDASAATTAAALAIPEYDSLAASQVVPRLSALSRDELNAVRSYEASHRGRRTILGRADQLLARSSGSEA